MQNTAARKRKQVPEGYLIVGIDPHKKKHAAVAITQDLDVRDRFKLDNTREGLEFLVRRVRTEMVKSGCRGVMFAIETRAHKSLGQLKVKLTNQLTAQLKNYYPVALHLFSGLNQDITLAFLERYPSPQKAAVASLKELHEFFQERGYSCPSKVPFIYQSLQQRALKAPNEMENIYQTIVLSIIPVLRSLMIELQKLADEVIKEFSQNPGHDIFSSLPTGEITAARLSAELGNDGARYPAREYLQTAAGTSPVTRRSGKTILIFFRWQCNKHLRDAFQNLARDSVIKCRWAKEYFTRQVLLGHKPSRAYRALANRWAAIIWKMLQENECFDQTRLEKKVMNMQSS